jgi:hypothetical protein
MVKVFRPGFITFLVVPNAYVAVDKRQKCSRDCSRDRADEAWLVSRGIFLSEDERADEVACKAATSVPSKDETIRREGGGGGAGRSL